MVWQDFQPKVLGTNLAMVGASVRMNVLPWHPLDLAAACMNDLGSVPTGPVCSVSFQSMYTKGLADAMGVKLRPLQYGIHLCSLQRCLLFAYTSALEIQQGTQLV